ncbi:MAG: hypothetical protein H6581_15440 [Bacteroidia bacterium]|nr:hypothetical protein [Bacteroidia bacterium]
MSEENQPLLQIVNYWNVSSVGLIVELYAPAEGPLTDLILWSHELQKQWMVRSRLIYNHALDEQTRFPGEREQMLFLSFEDAEKADHSRSKLLLNEAKGIFQYLFQPLGHSTDPLVGDRLISIKED